MIEAIFFFKYYKTVYHCNRGIISINITRCIYNSKDILVNSNLRYLIKLLLPLVFETQEL